MEAQSATITNQDARQAGPMVSQRGISLSRGGSGRLLLQLYSCCPRLVQLASQIRPCCLQVKQGPNRSTFVSSLPSLPPRPFMEAHGCVGSVVVARGTAAND